MINNHSDLNDLIADKGYEYAIRTLFDEDEEIDNKKLHRLRKQVMEKLDEINQVLSENDD